MKYIFPILLLFVLIQQISAQEPTCGWPKTNTTTESRSQRVRIEKCQYFQEYPEWEPCKTVFDGVMKKGEYFMDMESGSSYNSFMYMGDGSVCYSVYKNMGECNYRPADYGCLNYCVSESTYIYYTNIYDYYSCISKVDNAYMVHVGAANKLGNSILFVLLSFILIMLF